MFLFQKSGIPIGGPLSNALLEFGLAYLESKFDIIAWRNVSLTILLILIAFYIWAIIAGLTCGIRRMHDVGKSGWTLLWSLTGIGVFYLLLL